jgi:hypothetical protein
MTTPTTPDETLPSPLHADLIQMLRAAHAAEHDIFGALSPDRREAPNTIGEWSAKDVLAHLAAWRSVEARQLERRIRGESGSDPGDPGPEVPVDEANEMLRAKFAAWSWDDVVREADASVEALVAAIGRSGTTALSQREGIVVGIGTSGSNHAMGHLVDAARLAGARPHFDALARAFEEIVTRRHLAPRDSGVILYNLACYQALAGETDDARRLLRTALAHRRDLLTDAKTDPDLVSIRDDLESLASSS